MWPEAGCQVRTRSRVSLRKNRTSDSCNALLSCKRALGIEVSLGLLARALPWVLSLSPLCVINILSKIGTGLILFLGSVVLQLTVSDEINPFYSGRFCDHCSVSLPGGHSLLFTYNYLRT